MIARWRYWLLTHPRVARPLTALACLWGLSAIAVATAPQAAAATNSMVLGWTGMKDTYGVSPGDYFFAMASIGDQITQGGPGVDVNPASWLQWMGHTMALLLANVTVTNILTGEAGLFIGVVTLSLWIFRLTVSTYWLTVVGEIARAITTAVIDVTTRMGLLLFAVPFGVCAGLITMRRGEVGRGWTMILIALTVPALSVTVFSDPAGQMYGPDGLLSFGRRVGFSVAEAATHDGGLTGGGFDGQVDTLTASVLTHTVREPLQLWNFGHVVDRVGGCGAAWSAAVQHGVGDAPVRAMKLCGDTAAVSYAQHIDGSNIWTGLVMVTCSLLLGLFMVASGWAVLKVSVKAIYTTAKLLPALWLGGIPGAPQRHASATVWEFFRHGIEVLIYIVFVSVIGLSVERIVAAPLPAQLGGANPFAHILMMGGVCVAAFVLLGHIKRDLGGDRGGGRGMLGRATDVAVGMGMHAAFGGAASAALGGARGLRGKLGGARKTPWEKVDEAADAAAAGVLGEPRTGFNPVPGSVDPTGVGDAAGALPAGASAGLSTGSAAAPPGLPSSGAAPASPPPAAEVAAAVSPLLARPAAPRDRSAVRPTPAGRGTAAADELAAVSSQPGLPGSGAPLPAANAPAVPVVAMLPGTGHGEDIPPPTSPPGDDESPPPPDIDGPPAVTVDPIPGPPGHHR